MTIEYTKRDNCYLCIFSSMDEFYLFLHFTKIESYSTYLWLAFFKKFYLFVWLQTNYLFVWVLVASCDIFGCGMWD